MTTGTGIERLLDVPAWSDDPLPAIREMGASSVVLALDDDPTGTQTVRDVPVLTQWDVGSLAGLLDSTEPLGFLLTNSRALPTEDAICLLYTSPSPRDS